MKEIIDRILNGDMVNIARDDAHYYLSVSKDGDKYKVGFISPYYNINNYQRLDTEQMKEAGKLLIELADELESRKKFKSGDICFFVCPDGSIYDSFISTNDGGFLARIAIGNCFKSRAEAEAHKDDVLAKYQDLRDRGLI